MPSPFNLDAMREVYVSLKHLTPEQFAELEDGTRRINALDLGGLSWPLTFLARDLHGHIPWADHLQAWAAAMGQPYQSIEDFYARAIARGFMRGSLLNRTHFYQPLVTGPRLPIGRLMVKLGLISLLDLQRALGIQLLIKEETGLPARVGRILSTITPLSVPDSCQAFALHLGIPYVSVDLTMPIIERVLASR